MADEHGTDQPDAGGASAPPTLFSPIALDEAEALRRAGTMVRVLFGGITPEAVSYVATHLLLAYKSGRAAGLKEAVQTLHEANKAQLGGQPFRERCR